MFVNPKIFRTSTFRLAAIYLTVFALSAGAILGYVYYYTAGLFERQTEETIRAELSGLADQYNLLGIVGLSETINRRSADRDGGLYLLINDDGNSVAGNIFNFPVGKLAEDSWVDFPITVGSGANVAEHMVHGFHLDLGTNYHMFVGRDVNELRQFVGLIREALFWAVGLSLIMGLGGSFVLSRNFLKRVEAINETSRSIMMGDLSGRMPLNGSGDELDRLAGSLNEMLSQIERLMTGMKDVTSNVAHDLKTPLTRMRARVEAALRQDDKAEQKGALQQTIDECDQLLRTFNALISIAQSESGQSRKNLEPLDAQKILNDVVELYEPLVEEAGGTLTLETTPELMIIGNRQLLAQGITNLIDNAMKYGEKPAASGADITVKGFIEAHHVCIEVSDRGIGIPEQDRARVRDRFIRLDSSRSKPGNGLGLSLVSSVMTLHNGELILEDNNPGLRATLHLPLLKT